MFHQGHLLELFAVCFLIGRTTFSFASVNEISYILEDFDFNLTEVDNYTFFFPFDDNNTTALDERDHGAYTGSGFLRTQSSTISRFEPRPQERSYNCGGAARFSIHYRLHQSVLNSTSVSLQLSLLFARPACLSDSNCTTKLSTKPVLLENNRDWLELSWALADAEQWVNVNETQPNMMLIQGWEISTTAEFYEVNYIDYDHVSCHGGSELLESTLHAKVDSSIPHDSGWGNWLAYSHNSQVARNKTVARLRGDGVLSVDYVVQQTENWGGFSSFSFQSAGFYNLSTASAVSFDYVVREAASPAGHVVLRLILDELFESCDGACAPQSRERFYSFHYILDQATTEKQTVKVPLVGSATNDASFWFPGWIGGLEDKVMDPSKMYVLTWELSVDAELGMNSTVSGAFDISNFKAVFDPFQAELSSCAVETGLTLTSGWIHLDADTLVGHTACCAMCEEDPACLFSVRSARRNCGFASAIGPELGRELRLSHGGELETIGDEGSVSWMVSRSEALQYCDTCTCVESLRLIDCRGRDLHTIPLGFNESWMPKTLNLGSNPNLAFVGNGALRPVSAELEVIHFPKNLRFLAHATISDISTLRDITFEGSVMLNILDASGKFGDICCEKGPQMQLQEGKAVVFCSPRGARNIGTDALFLHHQEFKHFFVIAEFRPSSVFMPQAAESPQMCAEYCKLNPRCRFFQHDARMHNSEKACLHYSHAVALQRSEEYADPDKSAPGLVAGVAPRARGEFEGARVILSNETLVATEANKYKVSFGVSLGSMPQRGSVWIEPSVLVKDGLDVLISPQIISLDDNETVATVTVSIQDTSAIGNRERILVIRNNITTCDAAFSFQYADADRLQIRVTVSPSPIENTTSPFAAYLLVVSAVMVSLALAVCLVSYRRREDLAWKVDLRDLVFSEPPVVLGRGTFGLVLLAEWRGTQVAVKRVLPPGSDHGTGDLDSGKFMVGGSVDLACDGTSTVPFGSVDTTKIGQRIGTTREYAKLRGNLVAEMRCLSSLRHPNITTVMGALISGPNPLLVMELMDHGSLYDIIHNESMPLDGSLVLPILKDIAQGMRFLHVHKPPIIHGDLKAENCLVDSHFRAKVADFGLSAKETLGVTGTPYWMDPVLLRRERKNSTESDVYSFGIMLYELYSRSDPYEGEPFDMVLRHVCDPKINKRPPIPKDTPPLIASLMKECYSPNQMARPSFEEIDKRIRRIDTEQAEPGKSSFYAQQTKSARNETLLHKVFPKHVADALRDGRSVEPDRRDMVSVFFSDIVGFTEIASTLPAQKLTEMLDRWYTKLDALADKYGVFRIDVIGDAYMCATNLATDQPHDHAKRIAEFSIEAITAASDSLIDEGDPALGCIQIRCGFRKYFFLLNHHIHSFGLQSVDTGPVVAQVVGRNTPKYSVFGDAVNCASRMESSSIPGYIQCSSTSADLLKVQAPHITLQSRGLVSIKGKGNMHTYFVNPHGDTCEIERPKPPTESKPLTKVQSLRLLMTEFQGSEFGTSYCRESD